MSPLTPEQRAKALNDYCTVADDCRHHPVTISYKHGDEFVCEDCGEPLNEEAWFPPNDDPEPVSIPDLYEEPWTVSIDYAGDHWQVRPGRGLLGMENWSMDIHKPWRDLSLIGILRYFTVSQRREFPRTEDHLRKAKADCEIWCANMNRWEAHQRELGKRVL